MNRNWDIMRNAANGADPYGTTRRMDQNRQRDREHWTSYDREEGGYGRRAFEGIPDYEQGAYGAYRDRDRDRDYERRQPDRYRSEGLLGRMEQGIDRAFGNDWERRERAPRMRDEEEPSLWDRVKGAFSGKGPKNWKRSDERIREDVCEALTYHPHVDASDLEVSVKDGEVTLTGLVPERRMKRLAEDVTDDVRGVHDVHNQIRVQRPANQVQAQGISGQATTTTAGQGWNPARR